LHIPDGFMPMWESILFWIISLIFISKSVLWAKQNLDEKAIPLFAVLGAGIFAAQALNMPIPWGTSGHLVGAALTSIVFDSPWAGVLMLTLILIVQGLFFADGGILAMGANIFNMGIIGGFVGYYVYKSLKSINSFVAAFAAGWAATFLAAIACAVEMAVAGTFPIEQGLMFMGLYHAVIGILEGIITAVVVEFLKSVKPETLKSESTSLS